MEYNINSNMIRPALVNDVDDIYSILSLCANDMLLNYDLDHWIPVYPKENILDDITNKKVFVVENDAKLIACFTLSFINPSLWSNFDSVKSIYLSKLAVVPNISGKGIGKYCMKFIESFATRNNVNRIRFDVYDKSDKTISFYLKLGYKIVGNAKTNRFGVVLMEKLIGGLL
jgi:GNAT superfamily N-acetyltransferase